MATRKASEAVIQAIAESVPELWGGSADLAESNLTTIKGGKSFLPADYGETEFGGSTPVRPHPALRHPRARHGLDPQRHRAARQHPPFGGTFLVFSDYMRPAVRLAALMKLPVTYVWTHDSIGLGEDGPTHQPVEHVAALRADPGPDRGPPRRRQRDRRRLEGPDGEAHRTDDHGPVGIALTRQDIPTFDHEALNSSLDAVEGTAKGGYVLAEATGGAPKVILIGTGSEVQLAVQAREPLEADGIPTRVVSMPCVEWFEEQDAAYQESVLPAAVKARVSVEAGVGAGWQQYVGDAGRSVSLEHFGASADYQTLYREFGITAEAVEAAARESLAAAGA